MQIDTQQHDIPVWLVWGWLQKSGEMVLLNVALNQPHAKYTYNINKDDPAYLRVWIEPTFANHSFGGRMLYPAQGLDMLKQDKSDFWQDRLARARAFCSELIRAFPNPEKFRRLAVQYNAEFGASQVEIAAEQHVERTESTPLT